MMERIRLLRRSIITPSLQACCIIAASQMVSTKIICKPFQWFFQISVSSVSILSFHVPLLSKYLGGRYLKFENWNRIYFICKCRETHKQKKDDLVSIGDSLLNFFRLALGNLILVLIVNSWNEMKSIVYIVELLSVICSSNLSTCSANHAKIYLLISLYTDMLLKAVDDNLENMKVRIALLPSLS